LVAAERDTTTARCHIPGTEVAQLTGQDRFQAAGAGCKKMFRHLLKSASSTADKQDNGPFRARWYHDPTTPTCLPYPPGPAAGLLVQPLRLRLWPQRQGSG